MAKYDTAALFKHLNKWLGRGCSQCGQNQWTVQDSTFELREFNNGNMVIGGPIIPVIPIICGSCGNTVLVNAIVAGVIAREPEPKP